MSERSGTVPGSGLSLPQLRWPGVAVWRRVATVCLVAIAYQMLAVPDTARGQSGTGSGAARLPDLVFDDFEAHAPGGIPQGWDWIERREAHPFTPDRNTDQRSFLVEEEHGNRFIRVTTTDAWHRIIRVNDHPRMWSLPLRPCLSWAWRAVRLPEGAREDRVNDTGAAIYVYFGRDWLGRPRSLKYSYSSSLPVGTEMEFGPLRLIVVSSGLDGTGDWLTVQRNVLDDYRRLFDREPPSQPAFIALWSDSDSTDDRAIADFDDLRAGVCR